MKFCFPSFLDHSSECDAACSTGGCTDSHRGDNGGTGGINGLGLLLVHVLSGSLELLLLLLGCLSLSSVNSGLLFGTYGHGLITSTKDVYSLFATGLMVDFNGGNSLCVSTLLHFTVWDSLIIISFSNTAFNILL
jgi:hypothetical protein